MSDQMSPMQVAVRLHSLAGTIRANGDLLMHDNWASEIEALADELIPEGGQQVGDGLDAVETGAVEGEEGGRGEPSSPSLPPSRNVPIREEEG